MSITQRHNTEPLSGAAFTLATRTIGTVTRTTPDFDALVTTVLPHIEELTEDSPVTITVEADKLSLAWTGAKPRRRRTAMRSVVLPYCHASAWRRAGTGAGRTPDVLGLPHRLGRHAGLGPERIFDPVALVKIIDQWHHVPTPGTITLLAH